MIFSFYFFSDVGDKFFFGGQRIEVRGFDGKSESSKQLLWEMGERIYQGQ